MKKTLILIALALLIMVPVFAGTPLTETDTTGNQTVLTADGVSTKSSEEPKDTTVKIELKQYPKYMTAITTTKYSSDGSKISHYDEVSSATKYDAVVHETEIVMDVDTDTWTLEDKDGYYVTYYAYENNQNVEYSIKLNGNMKLTPDATAETGDTETPSSTKQKEIRYIMQITGINGLGDESESNTVTLYSDGSMDNSNTTIIRKIGKTVLIGKSAYNSYAMAVKAYTKDGTTDTVQYNIVGNYEGTVTLTIKSYS